MTQRIFDKDNKKDMDDLWDILPERVNKITLGDCIYYLYDKNNLFAKIYSELIKINWHDKTEITRPVQDATEQDIGKLCVFSYPQADVSKVIGILRNIKKTSDGKNCYKMYGSRLWYIKCRRLTKQEIENFI